MRATRIVIEVDGGLITDVSTCDGPIDVVVIDHDTEGADPKDIHERPDGAGYCYVSGWTDTPGGHSPEIREDARKLHAWGYEVMAVRPGIRTINRAGSAGE